MARPHVPVMVLAAVVLLGGCGLAPGSDADAGRLHDEAVAALARWAAAVAAGGSTDFVPVGELTGQIGDWEAAVGDNNKSALYAGMLEAAVSLSTDVPPDGEIKWPDGTSEAVRVLTATQALAKIREGGDKGCPTCTALAITAARLVTVEIDTSRGRVTVPAWAFSIKGTAVVATRVAIAQGISVQPPPWDPNHAPIGISVESASGTIDGRSLTVTFTGAPDPASQPCGEDYTGEAVETDTAIVVIIHVHSHGGFGACSLVGATRTASLDLSRPLGNRAVLEVKEGLPVRVDLLP